MSDLVKALQIFLKYGDPRFPTHCEHDVLTVCGFSYEDITDPADCAELAKLGFFYSASDDCWQSFRFGSA